MMTWRLQSFFVLIIRTPRSRTWPRYAQVLKVCVILSSLLCDGEAFSLYTRIVAFHRFVDYVPLVIDKLLVRGICEDLANVLRKSFRFSEPTAAEQCDSFLQEPPEVKKKRDRLKQRSIRLARAAEDLHDFWAP